MALTPAQRRKLPKKLQAAILRKQAGRTRAKKKSKKR